MPNLSTTGPSSLYQIILKLHHYTDCKLSNISWHSAKYTALWNNILTAVFPVMNPIFTHNRITIGSDLYSSQGVSVDLVVFNQTTPIAEHINTALFTMINIVVPGNENWFENIKNENNNMSMTRKANNTSLYIFLFVYNAFSYHCSIFGVKCFRVFWMFLECIFLL